MPPQPKGLPPLPDSLEKPDPNTPRGQILEAARLAFSEGGFDSTTTRAIAERAGVNLAMVHYYFGSKETLYRRVLAGEMVQVVRTIMGAMLASDRPAANRLLDMVDLVHLAFRADPIRLAIVRREIGQGAPHGTAVVRELGTVGPQGLRHLVLGVIEEGQRDGDLAPADPRTILSLLMTGAFGMLFVSPMLSVIFEIPSLDDEQWHQILEGQRALLQRAISTKGSQEKQT